MVKLISLCTVICLCLPLSSMAQPVLGESDLIPNGSFELLAKPDDPGGTEWPLRYVYNSLFWRQFHRYFGLNNPYDPRLVPPGVDRIYFDTWPILYDPVSCSSSDLFSIDQLTCDPVTRSGSIVDIPENWFGYQDLPAPPSDYNRSYAGIYYRLNGIRMGTNGLENAITGINAATDLWREYLEVELTRPLEVGKTYAVSYKVSLADVSTRGIRLETRLSPEPYWTVGNTPCGAINDEEGLQSKVAIPTTQGPVGLSHVTPQPVVQRDGWAEISYNIVAQGGERYFTLGNFEAAPVITAPLTPPVPMCLMRYYPEATNESPLAARIAYYYIDDVRVIESITCECGVKVCFQFTQVESSEAGKCCYKVQVVNGHRERDTDPVPAVCTIYGISMTDVLSNNLVYQWTPNQQLGPITGDGLWHDIGVMCVDEFSMLTTKQLLVSLKNQSGQEMCSQTEPIEGCTSVDPCNCAAFRRTVKVLPDESSNSSCCYKVVIDATTLTGCQIAAVKIYRGSLAHPNAEIPSAAYAADPVVPSNFSGVLYTFCPPQTDAAASNQQIIVQFLGPGGEVICDANTTLSCECKCGSNATGTKPDVKIMMVPVAGPAGSCCYDIQLSNPGRCRWSLSSIGMSINEAGTTITTTTGWTTTQNGSAWLLAASNGAVTVYNGQTVTIGTVCIPPCVSFDPKTMKVNASLLFNGQPCTVALAIPSAASCPGGFSCDDLQVSVERPRIWPIQGEDCCRLIRAKLLNCAASTDGIRVEVKSPSNTMVGVTHIGGGVFDSAIMCQNWGGQIYIVELRRADGTLVCSKPVAMPFCYHQEPAQ
jgi:hypothetical protein